MPGFFVLLEATSLARCATRHALYGRLATG
jgi:hypothetical protein